LTDFTDTMLLLFQFQPVGLARLRDIW